MESSSMNNLVTYELFEKKMVGVIYHFTPFRGLLKILKEDRMASGHGHISFTRNHHLHKWVDDYMANCRIAFNGSDMSDRFRIGPYLFDPARDQLFGGGPEMDIETRRKEYDEESEERIVGEEILDVKKDIIQVDILVTDYTDVEEWKQRIEEAGITDVEINFVDNLRPIRGQVV